MFRTLLSACRHRWFPPLLFAAFCCCLLIASTGVALAAPKMLMLSPVRAIFTDRERSLAVQVSNPTDAPISYSISVVTMRKDKDGKLREIENETEQEQLVRNMIRFSPRRATIEPGKRQVVKLMVQKPANLPKGEYQTHLKFTPLASQGQTAPQQAPQVQEGKPQFQVEIVIAASITVVIQHGVQAEVTPLACTVKETGKGGAGLAAEVKLARSGDASGFGNLRLTHAPAHNLQAGREIGRLDGVALYLPEKDKTVTVNLPGVSRKELASGTIRVEFEPDTGAGRKKRLKEGEKTFKDFPVR